MLPELPASFASTRDTLHGLAEHVVSAAYFQATQHIGLRPTPRGFGTPIYGDDERVRVDGTALVYERAGDSHRTELTTLRAAATFVGVPLGAPDVYKPATAPDPEEVLVVDHDAALALGDWYALGAALLRDLRGAYLDGSTELQIWPEHFDLACELGDTAAARANYGASPGDQVIPQPYLYVGPWDPACRTGMLGTHEFGGAVTYDELRAGGEAGAAGRRFFEAAAAQLMG